jgi:hypothetical protein
MAIGDDAHADLGGMVTSFFSPARLLRSDIAVVPVVC